MLVESVKCCGCGACADICPVNAIEMKPNEDGFLEPVINGETCKHCGRCDKVCPVMNIDSLKTVDRNVNCYAGYITDEEKLKRSASGGAATAFYESVLARGGCIFGVIYNRDFTRARFVCADDPRYIKGFRSSKYIQAEKALIYSDVKEKLDEGREVLFIGLPCEVAAMKAFLGKDYDNLTLVDLICYGPTSPLVAKMYLRRLKSENGHEIVDFNVRHKRNGAWQPSYLRAKFEGGEVYVNEFFNTDYGFAFDMLARDCCYKCSFKGDNKCSDITIGDFWEADKNAEYYNKGGTSAVMVHTHKGARFLAECGENMLLKRAEYADILRGNPMLTECREKKPGRDNFAVLMKRQGLRAVVDAYRPIAAGEKNLLKRIVKKLLILAGLRREE
ncbi:MAG: Coenzyme F420 hydrogenase/dehydrogenase, beta subunit C-terminal domain [Abditibacteriota bacterium]|nr:Coenzyme F420 hydrogenase/dehydrogenase, beta subunit C-terminal domain [Abditibacteriota bacterium]